MLFNWDPEDEIAEAHRLFSPTCPLVTGKPMPVPMTVRFGLTMHESPAILSVFWQPVNGSDGDSRPGDISSVVASNSVNDLEASDSPSLPRPVSDLSPLSSVSLLWHGQVSKPEKPAWEVPVQAQDAGSAANSGAAGGGHLSKFINSLRQGAAAAEVVEGGEAVMPLPKLERTAKTKAKAKATKGGRSGWEEYPAASMSDATGSDTDGPETTPTVTCGGATRADAVAPSAQTRADRLWKFDWSVPSVVKSGLRGEGAILDAAAGELEMRLNTAKVMLNAYACSHAVPDGYYRRQTGASAHKTHAQSANTRTQHR